MLSYAKIIRELDRQQFIISSSEWSNSQSNLVHIFSPLMWKKSGKDKSCDLSAKEIVHTKLNWHHNSEGTQK